MTSIKGTFEPRVVNNKGGEGEGEGEEWVMAYSTREQEKYGFKYIVPPPMVA